MSRELQSVGLDIGTSRVRCIVGESSEDGRMNIVGFGSAETKGMRRGIVTSTEAVADAVRRAVSEAERSSGTELGSATVNLSGEHFLGENKAGVVAVAGSDKEITEDDIDRAIDSASAMPLQPGWEVVDRLPQEFIIDGQDGITEPLGMLGSRLEARVHVIVSPGAGRQNLIKAVGKAGLDVERTLLEPLAAGESCVTDDDREYGCALVIMGAEITSLVIFSRGAVQQITVFPFGSTHFTKDIAVGLRVSIPHANRIKHDFGCVAGELLSPDERAEVIEIMPVGRSEPRGLSKEILCDIMQPRAIELMQHIAREARRTSAQISSGVILTGGGSLVRGLCEVAEQVFDAPTRLGYPDEEHFGGLIDEVRSPSWTTACGLARVSLTDAERRENSGGRSAVRRMSEWIEGFREKFR